MIDSQLQAIFHQEYARQETTLSLIASENIVSGNVLRALGSPFTNKTVEGMPGARFHSGATFADALERLTQQRACDLFSCSEANVQPHSCSQANHAALLALLEDGDTILSMSLSAGGHISHGLRKNLSGRLFNVAYYGVARDTHLIDMSEVADLVEKFKPRLIITGSSAYSRHIDFAAFSLLAKSVGAYLVADIAHVAGLVAGGNYPSPASTADVITCSTYKTLRGPRGGLVLAQDREIMRRINASIFPGLQGTPCLSTMAAKAVCLAEAADVSFRDYATRTVANARALAALFSRNGSAVVSGGTDTHIVMLDLRRLGFDGKTASNALEEAGILCNMNLIPFDERGPMTCSGLRFGVAAATTRGFGASEMEQVGNFTIEILDCLSKGGSGLRTLQSGIRSKIRALLDQYPLRHQGYDAQLWSPSPTERASEALRREETAMP